MEKIEWLRIRKGYDIPVNVCWEYYNDVANLGFPRYSLAEFEHLYGQYLAHCTNIPCPDTQGRPKRFDFTQLIKKLYDHFDNKFGL